MFEGISPSLQISVASFRAFKKGRIDDEMTFYESINIL